MGLFPMTLIESNAVKRLIILILSAVLLCPMWATAQTAPSGSSTQTVVRALNTLDFYLNLQLPFIAVASRGNFMFARWIHQLKITPYLPNNNSVSILFSGVAYVSYDTEPNVPVPVTGAILHQDNSVFDL